MPIADEKVVLFEIVQHEHVGAPITVGIAGERAPASDLDVRVTGAAFGQVAGPVAFAVAEGQLAAIAELARRTKHDGPTFCHAKQATSFQLEPRC